MTKMLHNVEQEWVAVFEANEHDQTMAFGSASLFSRPFMTFVMPYWTMRSVIHSIKY
jgi:hypothetical protein